MALPSRLFTVLLLTLAACSGTEEDWTPEEVDECAALGAVESARVRPVAAETVSPQLVPLHGCSDMAYRIREKAIHEMEQELDRNERAALEYACRPPEEGHGDDGASGDGTGDGEVADAPDDYSQTNNQVEGVDEADFVKNDAEHVYVTSNGALRIIDAWPAPEAHLVSEFEVEGRPVKMFVSEDRALVYSSLDQEDGADGDEWGDSGFWEGQGECTYGYECDFTGDGHPTKITILDISDRAHPVVEREIWLSGSLLSARRIGTGVHTVVSDGAPRFEGVRYWNEDDWGARPSEIKRAYDRLLAENRRIIREAPLEGIVPFVRDVVRGEGEPRASSLADDDCSSAFATGLEDGTAVTSVLSLDLASPGELALTSVVSRPGAVYASLDSLYMAVPHQAIWDSWFEGAEGEEQASSVHKFALGADPVSAAYRGSGVVKGRVLNQFAMDEREGDLRIATTSGRVPDPAVHSTMSVLRESEGGLAVVGRVDDLAPSEDIRSVRFDGDRGYIVTFKKTDPLFVLDLATPEEPRVAGELKIPGFSTYMHLMDPTHLLTIGYDAADQGDFAWFTGVLLQIFDVSDMARPTLAHRELIGTRGSSSEALANHLAFNYYPTREALALPMTICEGGDDDGGYGTEMTFSGLMVYRLTVADGFSLTGEVAHPPGQDIGCWNWWTNASSQVKRSVFMENYVFSISESRVKVNAMEALDADLVDIPLE